MSNNEILEDIQKTTQLTQANNQLLTHICHTLDRIQCESYSSDSENESENGNSESENEQENSESENEQENVEQENSDSDEERCQDGH